MTWEVKIIGALVALAIVLGGILGVRHVMAENRKLKDELKVAEQQIRNDGESIRQLDRYHNTTTIIREKEDAASYAVQAAPGAETPLDPDRRAILCDSLSRMRDGSPVCDAQDPTSVP
ncbi:MAG TPA: hypothetical protein VIO94_16055 [Phenylobacterium sp.]